MVRVKTFYNLTPLYLSRLPLVLSRFVPFVDDAGTSGSPAPLSWFLLFRLLTTLPPHLPSPISNVLVPEQVQPLLCIRSLTCAHSTHRKLEAQGVPRSFLDTLCRACPVGGPQMFAGKRAGEGPPKQTSYLAVLLRDLDSSQSALESKSGQPDPPLQAACLSGCWFGVSSASRTAGPVCAVHLESPIARAAPGLWQCR